MKHFRLFTFLLCILTHHLHAQALAPGIWSNVAGTANPYIDVPAGSGQLKVEFVDAVVTSGPSGMVTNHPNPGLTGIRLGSAVVFNLVGQFYMSSNSTHSSPVVNPPAGRYYFAATESGPVSGIGFRVLNSYSIRATITEKIPAITAQPSSRTVAVGGLASFAVTANGTSLTYQWRRNGSNIGGANASTYTISNVQAADAATYTVVVSNGGGNVTSSTAVLTVTAPAQITTQPSSITRNANQSGSFSVTATGLPAPTYQWRKDGTNISGATSATYTISYLAATHAGDYTVVVKNSSGAVTSQIARLTVNTPPQITAQPQALSRTVGQSATFGVSVTGSPAPTYQWRKNGTNIAGATSNTYSIASVTAADGGSYTVFVANAAGASTSNGAYLTVSAAPFAPQVIEHPQSVSRLAGQSASFSVIASGSPSPSYQWLKNGVNIATATASTFTISPVSSIDDAEYSVRISNSQGAVTSAAARLTVSSDPSGEVSVVIFPSEARESGAKWSVDGGASWHPSGSTVVLATGFHSLIFFGLPEYNTPPPQSIQIRQETLLEIPATYSTATGAILMGSGRNSDSQLGTGPSVPEVLPVQLFAGVAQVAASDDHSLFIKNDGSLWAMGTYRSTINSSASSTTSVTIARTTAEQIATDVTQISVGGSHSLFIKSDGALWAFGNNFYGQIGNEAPRRNTNQSLPLQIASGVAQAAAGGNHTLFVKTDGSLWAMGRNNKGQLGDGNSGATTALRIARDVTQVAAGFDHSLFIKNDGSLWAMGHNSSGQLGIGSTIDQSLPVQVATGVSKVMAGHSHSLFIKNDGSLWAMGSNRFQQLGDGTAVNRTSPIKMSDGVSSAAAGGSNRLGYDSTFGWIDVETSSHTVFIRNDGSLWATGSNASGQLGDGTSVARPSPVQIATGVSQAAAGGSHGLFVLSPPHHDPVSPLKKFVAFMSTAGLAQGNSGVLATPFDDGVSNLLKYAFNMNLAGPDSTRLVAGDGLSGLPAIALENAGPANQTAPRLRIEYLRRKDSGLLYIPEFSSDLAGSGLEPWTASAATAEIVPINEDWERVIVRDEPPGPGGVTKRFGRVRIVLPDEE